MANPLVEQANKIYRHCRQNSIETRRDYRKCFNAFCEWLWNRYRVKKLRNISNKHLRQYVVYHLYELDNAPSYIYKILSAIRFFHDFVSDPRYELERRNAVLGVPKRKKSGDRGWTAEEFEYMVGRAAEKGFYKLISLLVLGWELGLRIHEAVRLYRVDLERALKSGYLKAKGKGGKERHIKLTPIAVRELQVLKEKTPRGARVFVPEGERAHKVIYWIQKFIYENRPEREGEPLTYHGLRYSYAQRKYYTIKDQGLSTREAEKEVSKDLGHNRPKVTRGYLG